MTNPVVWDTNLLMIHKATVLWLPSLPWLRVYASVWVYQVISPVAIGNGQPYESVGSATFR